MVGVLWQNQLATQVLRYTLPNRLAKMIGTEVLTTVFLMQYSRFIAAATSLNVNTCGHDLWAHLCGLNPTDGVCSEGIRAIGGYIGDIFYNIAMSEVGNLPDRAITAGKKTSPWMDRFVLLTCIIGAWKMSDEVISAMESDLGWWATPLAVIILGLGSLFIASQVVLIIEKMQGIR